MNLEILAGTCWIAEDRVIEIDGLDSHSVVTARDVVSGNMVKVSTHLLKPLSSRCDQPNPLAIPEKEWSRCANLARQLQPYTGMHAMSYATKMCLRMMGWCLLPIFFAALVAWPMSAVLELPAKMGGQPVLPDLPWLVVSTGAAITLVLLVYQSIRIWRWEHGNGDGCFVCGCLQGRERSGRWGPYRKCLGCGKNHSMQNGIGYDCQKVTR